MDNFDENKCMLKLSIHILILKKNFPKSFQLEVYSSFSLWSSFQRNFIFATWAYRINTNTPILVLLCYKRVQSFRVHLLYRGLQYML